jgi:hypothetical protein
LVLAAQAQQRPQQAAQILFLVLLLARVAVAVGTTTAQVTLMEQLAVLVVAGALLHQIQEAQVTRLTLRPHKEIMAAQALITFLLFALAVGVAGLLQLALPQVVLLVLEETEQRHLSLVRL